MGEDFENSVDSSSFDDVSEDIGDASSFFEPMDVEGTIDDIPAESIDSSDVELLDSDFETEFPADETMESDNLMDEPADTYPTEDIAPNVLDSSDSVPSDIPNDVEDNEMDAGSDVAGLMDEAAVEPIDEVPMAPNDADEVTDGNIETLMNDVEPVSDTDDGLSEIESEAAEYADNGETEIESLSSAEEIPPDEVPNLDEGVPSDTAEEASEESAVSALMNESDIDDSAHLVDEALEGAPDNRAAEMPASSQSLDSMQDEAGSGSITDITENPQDVQGETAEPLAGGDDAPSGSPLDAGLSAHDQLSDYYNSHNYGQQDYAEYSKDPEWQELNNAYLQELGRDPIDCSGAKTPDIIDIHDEPTAAGIPENVPELEAISANEQAGIDAISETTQSSSPPADSIDDGASNPSIEPLIEPTEPIANADASSEPTHLSQDDVGTFIENSSDNEALQQSEEGIQSGEMQIDADDATEESGSGPKLTRDISEQWEFGNNAIDDNIEAMRDDLRDKGLEDGAEMESIVMAERARMQEELERNIQGDFSDPYQKPDFEELLQEHQISEETAAAGQDIPQELPEETPSVTDLPNEINQDEVFEGLDDYDFDGINYASDTDRLDSSLDNFDSNTWEGLTLDEQKAAMNDLAEYVKDVIGFDNPPEIVYYNNLVDGDYGGYSPESNTLEVNEYMLYNNEEAADTVAHELWHAYQHQRADNPQSAKDYQYRYGFDNYIRPEDDFMGYQDQLVEAEARAFAQQFKDRLNTKGRRI